MSEKLHIIKVCAKCKSAKSTKEFGNKKSTPDGLQYNCKLCERAIAKTWASNTRGSRRLVELRYRIKYPGRRAEIVKRSKLKDSEKTKRQELMYARRRVRSLNSRIAHNLRSRLGRALRGAKRAGSAVRNLGCSLEYFRFYIEGKFTTGMTWDNWSRKGWHLDHIIPLSSFDLNIPDQFLRASHYTNLQPLWALDNAKKGKAYARTA